MHLCELAPILHALAEQRQVTMSDVVRTAVLAQADADALAAKPRTQHANASRETLSLRMSTSRVSVLLHRSRAAAVTPGEYVAGLLDGISPAPLPADHQQMILALMASTNRLAALSVDINAFMRLLNKAQAAQLDAYRDSLRSLIPDVRAHLWQASELLAALDRTRRPRC